MRRLDALRLALLLATALLGGCAHAAGPRWVAGDTWNDAGKPMNWYRPDVQYFVDPGALSASVDHAAATALVDAAAAVWNVPGIGFTLTDGGTLGEDVSGTNVYPGANGPLWPQDVASSNYAAKQIAVIFDADGAITDTLLGAGASDPANCRGNAVTESVDLFVQPGRIAHALVILNGRCTGTAAEQQLQLRYQLMRVFGRVIGLGWSQTNDNVFTGSPAPVYAQQMHWPIMHPIDIVCGAYTYQCLPQPFTLRDDDVASLALLYAADLHVPGPNRALTTGSFLFPNGQGMNGVHVAVHRGYPWGTYGTDPYEDVSSVSGFLSRSDWGNPVTGSPGSSNDNAGTAAGWAPGFFLLYDIPLLTQFPFTDMAITTAPVNPLYVGAYAVGPYRTGSVTPSGTLPAFDAGNAVSGMYQGVGNRPVADAAWQCNGSADGTEDAPQPLPAGGVWSGRLCGVAHAAWNGFAVRAGRSATVEITATDETGGATTGKAMPLIGLWHGSDATGTLPTLARTMAAFNALRSGMTQMHVSFAADETVRMVVADQRGDGRPDYTYRARLLYADAVSPARLPASGGSIHLAGTGFTQGSVVTVGGVVATLVSLSATSIDAIAPSLAALGGTSVNDVTVTDPATGASTTITAGLTYAGASTDTIAWTTTPEAIVTAGAPVALSWKVTDGAGNAAANAAITLTARGGNVTFSACGLAACTLVTDASGVAGTQMTLPAAGSVTIQATLQNGASVQASFTATSPVRGLTVLRPTQYLASGAGAVFHPAAMLTGSDAASAAHAVLWTAASPRISPGAVQTSGATAILAATASLRDGEVTTVQACAWSTVCAVENLAGVSAADLQLAVVGGDAQSMPLSQTLAGATVRVVDPSGHPVAGAAVSVYQQVTGWQPACAVARCPAPPVYGTSNAAAMSDDDGLVVLTPLQFADTAGITRITVTVGTGGVVTLTLQKTP